MPAITPQRLTQSRRMRFNPIRTLTPDSLTRILDAYRAGDLRQAALLFDAIERRDDTLAGVIAKRKKALARLSWEILTLDDSPEAAAHQRTLQDFYDNLTASHATDQNRRGGLALLLKQMMDATAKGYAVHEILWDTPPRNPADPGETPAIRATFNFVPLWFFENRTGRIQFLDTDSATEGTPLDPGQWLVHTGDGLMEACSIAYLFKHLPLRDWLVYCERNGMPGVKGTTDAPPDSPAWDAARQAVEDFGAEFYALMSRGTDIEPIDLTSRGDLPYPALVERMDRAIIALWRGADLSTLSTRGEGAGASLQGGESALLEQDDAASLSETLNTQVGREVIHRAFGPPARPRAYLRIKPSDTRDRAADLAILRGLHELGLPLSPRHLREHFNIPAPAPSEDPLQQANPSTAGT